MQAASLPKANYSHLPERLRQIEVENLRTVRQLQAISNRQSHPYGPHKVVYPQPIQCAEQLLDDSTCLTSLQ
jgi:hypothetical protein